MGRFVDCCNNRRVRGTTRILAALALLLMGWLFTAASQAQDASARAAPAAAPVVLGGAHQPIGLAGHARDWIDDRRTPSPEILELRGDTIPW